MSESPATMLAPPPVGPVSVDTASPTFSVIIASYQAAASVAAAVESALAQTFPPFEVIVVDDGSTDGTDAVLAPFADRVSIVRQANGGEASARNAAARLATGDYLVILDADDWWEPTRLAALRDAVMTRPDLAVITTDAYIVEDGVTTSRYYDTAARFPTQHQHDAILRSSFVFIHAAVKRSSWTEVGGMHEARVIGVDWDLWRRIIAGGGTVGLVTEPLSHYVRWAGAMTNDHHKVLGDRIALRDRWLAEEPLSRRERRILRSARAADRVRLAEEAVSTGHPDARRHLVAVMLDAAPIADTPDATRSAMVRRRVTCTAWALRHLLMPHARDAVPPDARSE